MVCQQHPQILDASEPCWHHSNVHRVAVQCNAVFGLNHGKHGLHLQPGHRSSKQQPARPSQTLAVSTRQTAQLTVGACYKVRLVWQSSYHCVVLPSSNTKMKIHACNAGLLGTAALTSLPLSASDAAAVAATQETASAAGPPASSNPNAPSMPAPGASSAAALADADAAAAGSSSSCSTHNTAAATAARDPAINRGCATTPPARQQLSGLIPPRQVCRQPANGPQQECTVAP